MKIIFDIFPSIGHQNATHKLAKLLFDAGHRVYYIGEEQNKR
jgi:Glycosyl transferases, related to UDP-glucuronosyltransferase